MPDYQPVRHSNENSSHYLKSVLTYLQLSIHWHILRSCGKCEKGSGSGNVTQNSEKQQFHTQMHKYAKIFNRSHNQCY